MNRDLFEWSKNQMRNISVMVDRKLISSIRRNNRRIEIQDENLIVDFNLNNLILAIGALRVLPHRTKRQKFSDEETLIKKIVRRNNDSFLVEIDRTDADAQDEITEKFGMGLSVMVTDYLYRLRWSTIRRLKRWYNESKPDIEATSRRNSYIVWEAKGTIGRFSKERKQKAVEQKEKVRANVNFAAFTWLREHGSSRVKLVDPPSFSKTKSKQELMEMKAKHYIQIFSFLGQKELSEYFNLMKERIIHDRGFPGFGGKQILYEKIKRGYIRIERFNRQYLGSLEQLDEEEYIFAGIDLELISFNGFLNFSDYQEHLSMREVDNFFSVTKDGVIIAKLKDISFLEEQLKDKIVQHHQETISILDMDVMNHAALAKFIAFLFEKVGAFVKQEYVFYHSNGQIATSLDLYVELKGKRFAIEIKKHINIEDLKKFSARFKILTFEQVILITLDKLDAEIINLAGKYGIRILGRQDVKRIILRFSRIKEYIN